MSIITRAGAPAHLFAIPELDLSEDLFAKPVEGQWFRLAALTKGNEADARGVRDVVERRSFLLEPGSFEAVDDKLNSIGGTLDHLGHPVASIHGFGSDDATHVYRPFQEFEIPFTDVIGEPVAFYPEAEGERDVALNPDLPFYFQLEEKPPGSGCWWDPARGVEVIRHQSIGRVEFVEVRNDYLMKYLRVRQRALVIGHYRHFHWLNPTEAAIAALEKGEVVLRGPGGAKAIVQSYPSDRVGGSARLLIRRVHLWSQIMPPKLDVETAFDEEPEFDLATFTFPMRDGPVAPARFLNSRRVEGIVFTGVSCDFMNRVYFRQEALGKYQGASGFEIGDDGSVRCGSHWGLTRSISRIGNELMMTAIGDFAEGVPFHEWQHWRQHVVPPPSNETLRELEKEATLPATVNWVVQELGNLNEAIERFAASAGVPLEGKLWKGDLGSLAGRQLKWVYPASADDAEFLTRATLASTLILDAIDAAYLRRLLNAFGPNLHQGADQNSLGSRNLLQRTALIAGLICTLRPRKDELPNLVAWSETGRGAPDSDLQAELARGYEELRKEFAPLAFLYDLRTFGGLAHSPSAEKAANAAKQFGLAEKGWRRADFLNVLQQVGYTVEAVYLRIDAAASALPLTAD